MRRTVFSLFFVAVLASSFLAARAASAQATPTATQGLELTAFGAGAGTWTDVLGGRNLGVTAGADLAFRSFHNFRPAAEFRGTYPVHTGTIDAQKNLMGGLRVEYPSGKLHPYADILVGRGQIDYQRGGLVVGNLIYIRTISTVFSPGAGLDFDVSPHWSGKLDFQFQSWDVPFSPGTIHPKVLNIGAVYHFDFNRRARR